MSKPCLLVCRTWTRPTPPLRKPALSSLGVWLRGWGFWGGLGGPKPPPKPNPPFPKSSPPPNPSPKLPPTPPPPSGSPPPRPRPRRPPFPAARNPRGAGPAAARRTPADGPGRPTERIPRPHPPHPPPHPHPRCIRRCLLFCQFLSAFDRTWPCLSLFGFIWACLGFGLAVLTLVWHYLPLFFLIAFDLANVFLLEKIDGEGGFDPVQAWLQHC